MKSPIICRCEEIREDEVVQAVRAGCRTVSEVKRHCRAGMGLCQGRTCGPLMAAIIARETGVQLRDVRRDSSRYPLYPVSLGDFVETP